LTPALSSSKFGLDTTSKAAVKENTKVYTAKVNPPQKDYPENRPPVRRRRAPEHLNALES